MVLFVTPALAQLGPCTIETVVGGGIGARGDGGPAIHAELHLPYDARVGPDGFLYIADVGTRRIRRMTAGGTIETYAGTDALTPSGSAGPALETDIGAPVSLDFVSDGSLIFLESDLRVRRVSADGLMTTVAGSDRDDFSGDGGPAVGTGLFGSVRLAAGPDGSIYIAALRVHRIRKITPDGQIDTIAGTGPTNRSYPQSTGDGGPAVDAVIDRPSDIAVAPDGTVYFVEAFGARVRRISPDGIIDTYLVTGDSRNRSPDGTSRVEAVAGGASEIEVDQDGRLYWFDWPAVRRVSFDDTIETVWEAESPMLGSSYRFALAAPDRFHMASEDRVFIWTGEREQTLVAGVGPTASRGDGGPASEAFLGPVLRVDIGPDNEIYISDRIFNRVRVVRDGHIDTLAGTGESGLTEEGVLATQTTLDRPMDVAAGSDGNIFIVTPQLVYRVDPVTGTIARFAGGGSCFGSQCTVGVPAIDVSLALIDGIEVDRQGNLYILHDPIGRARNGKWISRVSTDGIMTLLPDDTPIGTNAGHASSMTLDSLDHLVFTEGFNRPRFWRVDAEDNFMPIEGGEGFVGFTVAMAADGEGNVYLSASDHIQRLTADGVLNTIIPAPFADEQFAGDGGPAGQAVVGRVRSMALDAEGNLYLADELNRRIRRINAVADCPVVVRPQIAAFGVRQAAGFDQWVSPGAIGAIVGIRLGPKIGVNGRVENGRFTTELAGTRVWVDDRPAAITYASGTQVNAIIPYATEISGDFDEGGNFDRESRGARIRVEYDGVSSEAYRATVVPAWPGLFQGESNLAAAFNQDGSLNGPLSPATPGTVVVLFGTGEGETDPPGVDGQLAGSTLPRPVLDVQVTIGGEPAEVLYFGAAPGLVAGVFQLNVKVPEGLTVLGPVKVDVRVGKYPPSPSFSVATRIIVGE